MSRAAIADGLSKTIFQVIFPGSSQVLSIDGTSVQSAAWQASTTLVRLFATQDVFVSFGDSPTAIANDAGSFLLPGGMVEYFAVKPGQKLAAIKLNANATLYVTEGNS